MNKVILIGRLAADPEVRFTQSGKRTANFKLAVNRFGGSKEADFIPVVAWEKLAEVIGNNLEKGRKVMIEGRMQVRSYETTDGQKRYVTEVVAQQMEFCDSKKADEEKGAEANPFGGQVIPEEPPF